MCPIDFDTGKNAIYVTNVGCWHVICSTARGEEIVFYEFVDNLASIGELRDTCRFGEICRNGNKHSL